MDASEFAAYVHQRVTEIHKRGRCCIISGGTGLYHRAIIHGLIEAPSRNDEVRARLRAERDKLGLPAMYTRLQELDPDAATKIYPQDWVRIERALEVYETTGRQLSASHAEHGFKTRYYDRMLLGCQRPRPILYEKIERRLDEMWTTGILEETQKMLDAGLPTDELPVKALGYKQAAMVLLGQCTLEEGLEQAKRETRRFAKRQLTWFRSDPETEWIDLPMSDADFETLCQRCRQFVTSGVLTKT